MLDNGTNTAPKLLHRFYRLSINGYQAGLPVQLPKVQCINKNTIETLGTESVPLNFHFKRMTEQSLKCPQKTMRLHLALMVQFYPLGLCDISG